MFEWWTELPSWLRLGIGLLLMLIGGGILAAGLLGYIEPGYRVVLRFPLVMLAVGFALFAFGAKTDSEKNGYRFRRRLRLTGVPLRIYDASIERWQ